MSYRYIGNKSRILPPLLAKIRKTVKPGSVVADLMCGTTSVAEALRVEGYSVVASDLMSYAFHHANVRLRLERAPRFARLRIGPYRDVLANLQDLPGRNGYFHREFSPGGKPANGVPPRKYFTSANARKIDAITARINEWEGKGKLAVEELSLLRHDLILAANRVANIAGTYGHFRSSWNSSSLNPLSLRPSEFLTGHSTDHVVLQGRAEDIAEGVRADLCYIDPPYMKRQYAANYHILETLARGDAPEAAGVSGLRPWRDQYSDFCSKLRVRDSFEAIIRRMQCERFLISYSEDGLLSKSQMLEFMSGLGKVTVEEIVHQRFKSNTGGKGGTVAEYIFLLTKGRAASPRRSASRARAST